LPGFVAGDVRNLSPGGRGVNDCFDGVVSIVRKRLEF
jgi:hypothetical protein